MKRINKLVALFLVLSMVFSLAACGKKNSGNNGNEAGNTGKTNETSGQTDQTNQSTESSGKEQTSGTGEFVIGFPQAYSGASALLADAIQKGAEIAINKINESGGVNGEKIRLIIYDDQQSPEEAVKIAQKMIEVDKVDAICGSYVSSCMLAAGNYYEEAQIPTVGNGIGTTWMEQGWEYIFRACPNSGMAIPQLLEKMQYMGIKTVSTFEGVDDASKSSADTFRELAGDYGIQILTSETCVGGETDFSGQIAKILNSNAQAVFVSCPSEQQPTFSKQLRQFGYDGLVFSKETISIDNMAVAGDSADYWAFVFPYVTYKSVDECDIPIIKEFLEAYQAAYNEMPVHDCAYRGYDAIMVLAEAARRAGTNHDGKAIRDALETIDNYEGLGGSMDFTQGDREGIHQFNSYIIVDGAYKNLDNWLTDGSWDEYKASHNMN